MHTGVVSVQYDIVHCMVSLVWLNVRVCLTGAMFRS